MSASVAFDQALALSRFGLGSTADGVAALNGPARQLLHDEIDHGRVAMPGKGELQDSTTLLSQLEDYQRRSREASQSGSGEKIMPPTGKIFQAEISARYDDVLRSAPLGFGERLVMFWMNHFAISVDKGQQVHITAGAYEREAIRPFVFGRFTDMLVAVETHPCMLYFLDNVNSTGPNSLIGQRTDKGLNENLAREIFELHTLGVGSGYTQADVTAFAQALTGWTAARYFRFRNATHQPGPQIILGKHYGDDGFFQAGDVMVDLAQHPATARHISTKLVRHFVADDPPQILVDRLVDAWLKTGGDLTVVYEALIDSDEAWAPAPAKLRTPQEFLVAGLRATGVSLDALTIAKLSKAMGQPVWQPSGPNGFSDITAAWLTPEGLSARLQAASAIAEKVPQTADPRAFAEAILGERLSDATRQAISRADSVPQGLTLALVSPDFMRR